MSKRRSIFIIMAALLLLLTSCSSAGQVMDGEDMVRSYTQISQDEAKQMMEQDGTQIIVDVRTQEEYDSGHIPGAICIPNESIGTEQPKELPDLDQVILIYCRSGNRSKQAAQKLFDMGYTNVYEFGGINDWTGEVVTETPDADTSQDTSQEIEPEIPTRACRRLPMRLWANLIFPQKKSFLTAVGKCRLLAPAHGHFLMRKRRIPHTMR